MYCCTKGSNCDAVLPIKLIRAFTRRLPAAGLEDIRPVVSCHAANIRNCDDGIHPAARTSMSFKVSPSYGILLFGLESSTSHIAGIRRALAATRFRPTKCCRFPHPPATTYVRK